jgi:glycosyltransferase involved in cell wall biosynthesis
MRVSDVAELGRLRPRVLVYAGYYTPAYVAGGPVKSIANLVNALGDQIQFLIVTRDRDLGSMLPFPGIRPNVWTDVGKAKVFYVNAARLKLPVFLHVIRSVPYDTLYLNSFWDPIFTTLPLLLSRTLYASRRRIVLAPRGEFSSGALEVKHLRKKVMLFLSRMSGLHSGVHWQATSGLEARDIREIMGPTARHIHVIENWPESSTVTLPRAAKRPGDPLRVVFLSRISPVKNLDFALKALALVSEETQFTIIGPREDQVYAEYCDSLERGLPPHVSVVHHGPIEPRDVLKELSNHDLFFLPTRGENFGHVIAEALQAGLRLLISDQTPWRHLERENVGCDLSLDDPGAFAAVINAEARRPADGQQLARNREFLKRTLRNEDRIAAARALFSEPARKLTA